MLTEQLADQSRILLKSNNLEEKMAIEYETEKMVLSQPLMVILRSKRVSSHITIREAVARIF